MDPRTTWILLWIALAGCSANGTDDAIDPGPGKDDSPAACADVDCLAGDLSDRLEESGFTVQAGAFEFVDIARCEALPTCFGNNPTSPYGTAYLPPSPGQTVAEAFVDERGLSPIYRLRPDEAVVLVVQTPPAARYFGYQSYVFEHVGDSGERQLVFASMGDAINAAVIATGGEDAPFGEHAIIISTADQGTDASVRAAAAAAGISDSLLNTEVIPSSIVNMGIGADSDTFNMLDRVARFADADAGSHYVADPPVVVLRVTPTGDATLDPFPLPAMRVPGTGAGEAALGSSLDELEAAVRASFADFDVDRQPASPVPLNGRDCIATGVNCNGDATDTIYSTTPFGDAVRFPESPDDFVMVIGVNHRATGKASYSSFTITLVRKLLGVVSVVDDQMAGSAERFVPDDPAAGLLYAYKVARDCHDEPFCVELPFEFPGVPMRGRIVINDRAYLEPGTNTRPDASELVMSRMLVFHRRCPELGECQ